MESTTLEVNQFETLKAAYTVARPQTIRDKLAAWAFDDETDVEGVIRNLESLDCAACYSPAPVYNHAMAGEIGEHWPEIDAAFDDYRETFGEAWTPDADQGFLAILWFAYERTAQNLADELRIELKSKS